MDLSPSAFHVERRTRAGIFRLFVPLTHEVNTRTPLTTYYRCWLWIIPDRNMSSRLNHLWDLVSSIDWREQPLEALFVVPPSALMNVKTLSPVYPGSKRLSAHQLISLHLYLHKPPDNAKGSTDSLFGTFISILPREFDSHPLRWLVHKGSELESALLELLPCSTRFVLDTLEERFKRDSSAVTKYLVNSI